MRVFHASPCIVDNPDTEHSRSNLDFGRGFYVTTIKKQAIDYAQRFIRRGKNAYLNEYELSESALSRASTLHFKTYCEEWLDFVMACRQGIDLSNWDIVIGGIANDRVFTTVDLYSAGEINKEVALGRLAFEHPNDQICFRTQIAIDESLQFVAAEEVR